MSENKYGDLGEWYDQRKGLYEELTKQVERTILDLVNHKKIDYANITSRVKTKESLMEKVGRKSYLDPKTEVTDLSGVRLITYIESDVAKACSLIESSFNVNKGKSSDKSEELGVDRVGYRSIHFVCDLGEDRLKLPELSKFKGMFFEVQVRTILQHAWAQIQHERDYKFSGVLPEQIKRRLYRLAAVLELVDSEFDTLASKLDTYAEEVTKKVSRNEFDVEINTTSLLRYLSKKLSPLTGGGLVILEDGSIPRIVIAEMESFGLHTLADLNEILSAEFLEAVVSHQSYTSYAGLLRDAMLYVDIDRYFDASWNNNWQVAESYTFEILSDKYGAERVERVFQERGIKWN